MTRSDGSGYYACVDTSTGELATSTTACGASSERFKENIQDLTYGLDTINELRPVSFDWKESFIASGTPQIGLIAEEVAISVPEVIGYDSTGRITNLDYPKLVAITINAIQELTRTLTDLKDTVAGFAERFVTEQLVFENAVGGKATVQELCVGDVCVTEEKFRDVFGNTANDDADSSSASDGENTNGDSEAPTITINGNNPAHVEVGSSYGDLGASVVDPATGDQPENKNLGIKVRVNGEDVGDISNVSIDTSTTSMHKITYRATDQAGNTGTATRTVIVGDGASEETNTETNTEATDSTTATSTTPSTNTEPAGNDDTQATTTSEEEPASADNTEQESKETDKTTETSTSTTID